MPRRVRPNLLTRISVRNLACFGDEDYQLDLAPETVIVGPNNIGKSLMLAGFNFLRNLRFSGWQWDTSTYGWESPETIAHNHERGRSIKVGATIDGQAWSGRLAADFGRGSQGCQVEPTTADAQEELRNVWYLRASRSEIPRQMQVSSRGLTTSWQQPLEPDGSNVITYLLERYTSRDEKWDVAEEWLQRIVPEFSVLKSPLRGMVGSIETQLADSPIDINVAYQGTGTQKALSTIAAVVFSPDRSTIIVEEPEIHLHPRSQEVLVDLFNLAVNKWGKQVIFTTHSWDMLLPFISDVGQGTERGKTHSKADPSKFKLVTFAREGDKVAIRDFDLKGKDFVKVRTYFKQLWGLGGPSLSLHTQYAP